MDNENETFTLEELKATEKEHSAWHDGYCKCAPGSGWVNDSLYDIGHIVEVIKANREAVKSA